MGRATYYSPFGLGVIITLLMHGDIVKLGQVATLPPAAQWAVVVLISLIVAVHMQLLMIGAQGAFGQVLPAPIGRSIRGRGAVLAGVLMIAYVGVGAAALLIRSDEFALVSNMLLIAAGAGIAAAIVTYVWCWPVAAHDFDDRVA